MTPLYLNQNLVEFKRLKNLTYHWDKENKELLFERDKRFFAIYKNEIFPTIRALTSATQRFRNWKRKKK